MFNIARLNYTVASLKAHSARYARLLALMAAIGLPVINASQTRLYADTAFSFRKYFDLNSGAHFHIIGSSGFSTDRIIGQGQVLQLDDRNLHLRFNSTVPSVNIHADVRLRFIKREQGKIHLDLVYKGNVRGTPEESREIVLADAFLADNGYLSFYYLNRAHFIQASITSAGVNKFVTDWGGSRIEATSP